MEKKEKKCFVAFEHQGITIVIITRMEQQQQQQKGETFKKTKNNKKYEGRRNFPRQFSGTINKKK